MGSGVPVRGLVDAVGHAATVLVNQQQAHAVALPCTSLAKGKDTAVVINADDSVLDAIATSGLLFGAYHNILTTEGVSAIWNGYVGAVAGATAESSTPLVAVDGKAALVIQPNNLAFPAKHIVFYEKGAAKATLTSADAAAKLLALTDESKADAIKAILDGAKVTVIGSASDISSIF